MKAIVTGFTLDGARGESRVKFQSLPQGLRYACEQLGWDYRHDFMSVDTNEEMLKEADVMFVCLGPFNGLSSRFVYGALDAIAKAKKYNCGLVFYVTDWQLGLILSSARTMVSGPWRFTKPLLSGRSDFLWAVHNQSYLINIIEAFIERPWPETIVPLHTWWEDPGRDSHLIHKHIPARRLCALDPTTITTDTWQIDEPVWEDKQRQWVSAALGKQASTWIESQDTSWPIELRGGSTFDVRDGKASKRVTEREVIELYRQSWGACSPKTSMYKTGWWRTRYSYAVRSGAVLLADPDEISPMGPHFGYTAKMVESFTDSQLRGLAEAQRAEFESKVEPLESVLDKIRGAATRAIGDLA